MIFKKLYVINFLIYFRDQFCQGNITRVHTCTNKSWAQTFLSFDVIQWKKESSKEEIKSN